MSDPAAGQGTNRSASAHSRPQTPQQAQNAAQNAAQNSMQNSAQQQSAQQPPQPPSQPGQQPMHQPPQRSARQPARQPAPQPQPQPQQRPNQKSTLGFTPMTPKPGRAQHAGRAAVPAPGRAPEPPVQGPHMQSPRNQDPRTQNYGSRGGYDQGGGRPPNYQGKAKQGKVKQGKTNQSKAKPSRNERGRGPAEPGRVPVGLTAWIRRRRTRAHLNYLPKWVARRTEPFDIGGLHWLPAPSPENRGPAIALHGGQNMLLALAEMSPTVLRGPESANLGARLASVLTGFSASALPGPGAHNALLGGLAAGGPGSLPGGSAPGAAAPYRPALTRIQVLHQVPGSAGRTRSYLVLGFHYTSELVDQAARLGQGERGLTLLVARAAETVFAVLGDPGPRGGHLGTLVPLDRAGWTRLLGALVLPGRGDLVNPQAAAPAWRPTEIDALAPRFIAVTAPIGTAGQTSSWWHATSWVKRWPRGIGGLDLAACAGFLPPGVSGTASVVLGLRPGEDHKPTPTVAGYLTVSGHDAVEVELARVAAHAAADARDGFIEFCDRHHHLAFAQTLPLALGLAG